MTSRGLVTNSRYSTTDRVSDSNAATRGFSAHLQSDCGGSRSVYRLLRGRREGIILACWTNGEGNMRVIDRDEARKLKAHLDDAVATLGVAMRERFAPGLAAELGRTWFKRVRPAQGNFAEYDFASYADCLLGDKERTRDHRELFRRIANRPWAAYGHALETAKRARNTISHPDRPFTQLSAAQLLDDLAGIAVALDLSPAHQLVDRAHAIRVGDLAKLGPHLEDGEARLADLEAAIERQNEEKAALAERARNAEERRAKSSEALTLEIERRQRESELRRQAEERLTSVAHDRAERARLERDSELHRRAAEDAQARADAAESMSRAARADRDELERQFQASQQRMAELEKQARVLSAQIVPPPATGASIDLDELRRMMDTAIQDSGGRDSAADVDDPDLAAADGTMRVATLTRPPDSTALSMAFHSVLPGEKWPYGAGEFSYSLRPSAGDIYEYETDTWLSDVIGKKKARKVFDRLAAHRPEGGTIRVDSDGDVSTQRKTGGGRFYLGRVTAEEWFPDVIDDDSTEPTENQPSSQPPAATRPLRTAGGPAAHSVDLARSGPTEPVSSATPCAPRPATSTNTRPTPGSPT